MEYRGHKKFSIAQSLKKKKKKTLESLNFEKSYGFKIFVLITLMTAYKIWSLSVKNP